MLVWAHVKPQLLQIFRQSYREVRPRTPMPEMTMEFYAFAGVRHTIRMRGGRLLVRVSDLFASAPESVLIALAHLLLSKMYDTPVAAEHHRSYRAFVASPDFAARAQAARGARGRKYLRPPRGHVYDLEPIFEDLNAKYFHGALARPRLSWGRHARRRLGHYDEAHHTIVVSSIFDDAKVPRYALEYLLYHEMLHLKHPVEVRGGRRCVHSPEFVAEERQFPQILEAKTFLRSL